jgi:DNA-binding protein HU-beta
MNKSELVDEIAKRTKLPVGEVALVVEAFIETVRRWVLRGDKVTLSGFGTFHRRTRAKRTARDIWGEKPLPLPATNVPAFRPGKPVREAVARRGRRRPAERKPLAGRARSTRKAT